MSHKHRKIEAPSGHTYIVGLIPNAAQDIHVDLHEYDDSKTPPSMRGYGGSTLNFDMEDGSVYSAKGPWHTNSHALFKETGLLITDLHLTQVTLWDEEGNIIYKEDKPVLGQFMRGERIAQQMANLHNKPIRVRSESRGGSSEHTAIPNTLPHVMAMRGEYVFNKKKGQLLPEDEAWKSKRVIYGGYTFDDETQRNRTYHYTDDKDCLPPTLREYEEQEIDSVTTFLREAFKGEQRGLRYNIQIGDLYYETPEE